MRHAAYMDALRRGNKCSPAHPRKTHAKLGHDRSSVPSGPHALQNARTQSAMGDRARHCVQPARLCGTRAKRAGSRARRCDVLARAPPQNAHAQNALCRTSRRIGSDADYRALDDTQGALAKPGMRTIARMHPQAPLSPGFLQNTPINRMRHPAGKHHQGRKDVVQRGKTYIRRTATAHNGMAQACSIGVLHRRAIPAYGIGA